MKNLDFLGLDFDAKVAYQRTKENNLLLSLKSNNLPFQNLFESNPFISGDGLGYIESDLKERANKNIKIAANSNLYCE